jgi:hypothetical protein
VQRQHAGGAQHQVTAAQLGAHQRHARPVALGEEDALRVHHHPGTVEVQAGIGQQRLAHLDAGAGLDGVDEQPGDGAGQVVVRTKHGGRSADAGAPIVPSYNPAHGADF